MILVRIPYTELPIAPTEAFPNHNIGYYPAVNTFIEYQARVLPFSFLSIIDSGADNCVFPAIYGRQLNIPIESGKKYPYAGATGPGLAYFHSVTVRVKVDKKNLLFECYCGFADGLSELGMGLLGRHGFFELFDSVNFKQKQNLVELELPAKS